MNAITPAASVLLARSPGSPEVYVVRRSTTLRFFGGFYAFPGGKVAPDDAAPLGPGQTRRVAAARELFEEVGVLLARRADGTFPVAGADLEARRRQLLSGELAFPDLLRDLGLVIRPDDFAPLGTLTTPAFTPLRFETTFFVAHLPPGQTAEVWPGELDRGAWTTAEALLHDWHRGTCLVSPPTVTLLEAIHGRAADAAPARLAPLLARLDAGALPPIFFAPHVQLIPLHTQALPPSTHTNAFRVGTGPRYLLDPGPNDPAEQRHLFEILDDCEAASARLTAILLTHHHPDHVGAVTACAQRYRVPVYAHALTASALAGKLTVERLIADGERLPLGTAPDGSGPWHLEAVHTPGHAPGHLAFVDSHYRLLFAGDMVSTVTSILVAPPEGDLTAYLDSLRKLHALETRLLLPSHGGASAQPRQTLDECLAHRRKREDQLVEALAAGPRGIPDLARELYRGLPAEMMRFAEGQLLAGLVKLQREGRVEETDAYWQLR